MSIPFNKYINITSAVAAAQQVSTRDYIIRLFTINPLLPTGSFKEFTALDDVGDYFGTTSDEYKRAQFYFSWISKVVRSPQKICFARWTDEDTAPLIFGTRLTTTLAQFQAITTGSFTLVIGGTSHVIGGLDFSATASLADVADEIQTVINAQAGTQWTAATVVYDAARGAFNFTGGDTGTATISATTSGSGTQILDSIGWNINLGTIFSAGDVTTSITDTLTASAEASNNFGSFLFMPTLTDDQIAEASEWNATTEPNVQFMYLQAIALEDAVDTFTALHENRGTGVTISAVANYYPEMLPGMIWAATDYTARNTVQNYMYQQADLAPSITTKTDSDLADNNRANYYGQTQTAGRNLSFYQRGVLMGAANDPTDMGTYANEAWLKDAAAVSLMQAFLTLNQISADAQGISTVLGILQSGAIDPALFNGTIRVGKILTPSQKAYITQVTGSNTAWQQVQNIGYWIGCNVSSVLTEDSRVEFEIDYILIYSKDDVVRKVNGTHILI